MHPLLTRNRLGLYLLAWVPLAATSAYVLATRGALGWLQATVLAVAVYLFYALLCLSAWYPCRATPLGKVSFIRLLLTHLIAAVLMSFVWTRVSGAISYAILSPEQFAALSRQFQSQLNTVFTVGILLYLLSVAFHYVLIAMEESRHAEAQAVEARILARDAELKALKAQVNPHFLFNSLNSISALTSVDPAKAREMCILLAEFLRMTLGLGEKSTIRLSEELALLERFLAIEKVRFGSRLHVEKDQVGLMFCKSFGRFEAVGALRKNFDLGVGLQQFANNVTREFLIVHNECANLFAGRTHFGDAPDSAGRDSWTRKQLPSALTCMLDCFS